MALDGQRVWYGVRNTSQAKGTADRPAVRWTRGAEGEVNGPVDSTWIQDGAGGLSRAAGLRLRPSFFVKTLKGVYASACVPRPISGGLMPRCGDELGKMGAASVENWPWKYRYLREPRRRTSRTPYLRTTSNRAPKFNCV